MNESCMMGGLHLSRECFSFLLTEYCLYEHMYEHRLTLDSISGNFLCWLQRARWVVMLWNHYESTCYFAADRTCCEQA
jgi:hypothetical protein